MSDTILEHDDLTPTQEYSIAAGVILLFGLLYWIFNYGMPNFGAYSGAVPAPVVLDADTTITARHPERLALDDVPAPSAGSSVKSTASATSKNSTEKTTAIAETTGNEQQMLAGAGSAENTGEEQLQVAVSDAAAVDTAQQVVAVSDAVDNGQQANQVADSATDNGQQQAQTVAATNVVIMDAAVSKLQDYLVTGELEKPVVMGSIRFASGSSEIELKSDHQIEAIAGLLQQYPDTRLLIRGHTDSAGPASENKELSLMRARAMGQKLVEAGVNSGNIIIMGMGSAEPLSGSNTQQVQGKDRRIDVSITQ